MKHIRFTHIANAIYSKPWLIAPAAHASIRRLFEERYNRVKAGETSADNLTDLFGELMPEMTVQDGIAIVPIRGIIGRGLGQLEKSCGAVDTEDIAANIAEALANPDVTAIMLDINSPGGTVNGVPECAEIISFANEQKPVMAYSSGEACSAAFWIASSARACYGSVSAEWGSVGCYLPWVDETAAYAQDGLRVELIKNTGADFKGAGYPGTTLTPEQKAELQRGVDQIFAMFAGHVLAHRGQVSPNAMRGQTFMSAEAKQLNLIDEVATFEQAIADLKLLAA